MNEFEVLKKNLEEALASRRPSREEREEEKKVKRQIAREADLPKSRVCPNCGDLKPNSQQWSYRHGCCRSCSRVLCRAGLDADDAFEALFSRGRVHGPTLVLARTVMGLSRAAMARRCGWSKSTQGRLERTGTHRVSGRQKRAIVGALSTG